MWLQPHGSWLELCWSSCTPTPCVLAENMFSLLLLCSSAQTHLKGIKDEWSPRFAMKLEERQKLWFLLLLAAAVWLFCCLCVLVCGCCCFSSMLGQLILPLINTHGSHTHTQPGFHPGRAALVFLFTASFHQSCVQPAAGRK